jgi:outer membrane protein, multidrug efflux system
MAAVILLPLLTACALTQDRFDPALEVPRAYRAAHGSPNGARPPLDWWQTFRFPELTDLMQQAGSANFSIAAVARIVQAGTQDRIAGAALLPTLNAMAIAQKSRAPRWRASPVEEDSTQIVVDRSGS